MKHTTRRHGVTPSLKKLFAISVFSLSSTTFAANLASFGIDSTSPYSARLSLGGMYQNHDESYDQLDFLFPLLQNRQSLFFLDVRGVDVQGPAFEGNFGLGYRQLSEDNQTLYGIYSFFDRKHSNQSNYFNQVTIGGELKTLQWSYGANVYIPVGTTSVVSHNFDDVSLVNSTTSSFQNIVYRNGVEKAMPGADVEVGYTPTQFKHFTGYLGAYYFNASEVPTVAGPRARITYDMPWAFNGSNPANHLTLETLLQHDNVRGTQWGAGVRLSFGFGGAKNANLQGLERHMLDYVVRDYKIISGGNSEAPQQLLRKPDGSPVQVMLANDVNSLNKAINGADVIFVHGKISGLNTITLKPDQYLTGGSYSFGDGKVLKIFSGGTLSNQGSNATLIQVTQNNTVRDLNLQVDANQASIANNGQTVGQLFIDNINSNGGMHFAINDQSTNSTISLSNNKINLGNLIQDNTAISVHAFNSSVVNTSIVNNNIVLGNVTADNIIVGGIDAYADSNGQINFINGIRGNNVTIGESTAANTLTYGILTEAKNASSINVLGGFNQNTVTLGGITNPSSYGYGIYTYVDAGQVNYSAGFNNNIITIGHYTTGLDPSIHAAGVQMSARNGAEITYTGFHGNRVYGDSSSNDYAAHTDTTSGLKISLGVYGSSFDNSNDGLITEDFGSAGNTLVTP